MEGERKRRKVNGRSYEVACKRKEGATDGGMGSHNSEMTKPMNTQPIEQ